MPPPDGRAGVTTMGLLDEARETLAAFERAATARRRVSPATEVTAQYMDAISS